MMDFSGRLSVTPAQRVNFMGTVDLDETLRMRDFHMDLSTLDPPYRVRVSGDAALKSLSYEVRLENLPVAKQTLPMNAASIGTALAQNLGMDPRALPIAPSSIAAPAITARETELMLGGMQQEVYQVTVTENTAAVIDFYVTELGQIILAKTGFGYTLSSEEWQ